MPDSIALKKENVLHMAKEIKIKMSLTDNICGVPEFLRI